MKIAIITQPLGHNYGGILQNYALQQLLINLGHDPITLEKDYRQHISILQLILELPKRIFTKYFLKKREFILSEYNYNTIKTKSKKLFPFVAKYINHKYIKDHSLANFINYDSIIVGSDQVWRPIYNCGLLEKMFLSFIPESSNIKRIAFGASFGTFEWEFTDEQTSLCQNLIQNFDAVSTREIDGVDLCKIHLNRKDAVNVLDPTLLLEKDDYLKLCKDIPITNEDLLFAYILDVDTNAKDQLEKIAQDKRLKLKLVSADSECSLSVDEWLAMFRDAKMVITDSFHGTVFSIIFNKEFYSIANQSRGGSRFSSLLGQFNLSNRLFNCIFDINYALKSINWGKVESLKQIKQQESINFLINSIS